MHAAVAAAAAAVATYIRQRLHHVASHVLRPTTQWQRLRFPYRRQTFYSTVQQSYVTATKGLCALSLILDHWECQSRSPLRSSSQRGLVVCFFFLCVFGLQEFVKLTRSTTLFYECAQYLMWPVSRSYYCNNENNWEEQLFIWMINLAISFFDCSINLLAQHQ